MSRSLAGTLACVAPLLPVMVLACRPDSGLDIVRVPASAYLAVDAAIAADAGGDAHPDAAQFMLCITAPQSAEDDETKTEESSRSSSSAEMSDDFPDCPKTHEGRNLDPRVTQRHRDKDEDHACCYRERGSPVQGKGSQGRGE